ncbi:LamG domain-containing protein [Rhodopirellula bahusiensis]|uniref:FecR protein n=1 Tax=Rhodopirellula bahusiensis TaxID=2014065 RepID=A0A2G1VZM6_9BACT|nr:LamG domain-containing protein [Rhodopirellula bahusiensis]PHQ32181.1 hypothetical protein CEE69_27125 [Rhodopirellula bahusiensis]
MNDRLEDLIDQYCAGCIEESDFVELQSLLRESEANRQHYYEILQIHSDLHELVDTELHDEQETSPLTRTFTDTIAGEKPQASVSTEGSTGFNRIFPTQAWMLVASVSSIAAAFLAVVVWQQSRSLHEHANQQTVLPSGQERKVVSVVNAARSLRLPTQITSHKTDSLAILQQVVDPVWNDGEKAPRVGDELTAQTLDLQNGIVHLAFLNGATAILEGPARLDLINRQLGVLHHGKIRCFVPESAHGFTIETSTNRFVDLGTQFGLDVGIDGEQELHVFDGEVEMQSIQDRGTAQRIVSGYAISRDAPDHDWSTVATQPTRFTSVEKLWGLKQRSDQRRYERWKQHIETVLEDPDLVVLYDFEPDASEPSRLTNQKSDSTHGTILGCEWSRGRWDGKYALEFKRPNNRVQFNLPGTFDDLTMMTWLRIDGFDRFFSSLMSTDRFDNHHIHWHLKSTGQIGSGIKPPSSLRVLYDTEETLGYEDLGRWMHLALVVNQTDQTVTHFLNGQVVGQFPLHTGSEKMRTDVFGNETWPIRVGKAELGNWSPAEDYDEWLVRNLNGRIDEFSVFRRALGDQEIQRSYELGKPNS